MPAVYYYTYGSRKVNRALQFPACKKLPGLISENGATSMTHSDRKNWTVGIDYPVFSEAAPPDTDLAVFDTEYRLVQAMKRIAGESHGGREPADPSFMRELLASANGAAAFDVSLETLLSHIKDLGGNGNDPDLIPVTMIAWKPVAGRVFCGVERIFLKWDDELCFEDNVLCNAFMEQAGVTVPRLLRGRFCPVAAVGKGDYVKTLRRVFAEQFGYALL